MEDEKAIQDLQNERVESHTVSKIMEVEEKLSKIRGYVKESGFQSIFDLFQKESKSTTIEAQRDKKRWLDEGYGLEILSILASDNKKIQDQICDLAEGIYDTELKQLTKSPDLKLPLDSLHQDAITNFSLDSLHSIYQNLAPRFFTLLKNLVKLELNHEQDGQRKSHIEGNNSDSDDLNHDEEEEDDFDEGDTTLMGCPTISKESRHQLRRKVNVISALSSLCYARNRRANFLQVQTTYFAYAHRTPKRVIEAMSQLGIMVGYKSITRGARGIAKSVTDHLRGITEKVGSMFSVIMDNVNIHGVVKTETFNNRSPGALNWMCGYLAINAGVEDKEEKRSFKMEEADYSKGFNLRAEDLTLKEKDMKRNINASNVGIYKGLHQYFSEEMSQRRGKNNKLLCPIVAADIFQLPTKKTLLFSLWLWDKDETNIQSLSDVLFDIMRFVESKVSFLQLHKILHQGDQLTVRNIR
jgi:hypothetical protein